MAAHDTRADNSLYTGFGRRSGGGSIHIGRLPGRKSYALYELREHHPRGASIHPLAYFKSEDDARAAIHWLDFLGGSLPATYEHL